VIPPCMFLGTRDSSGVMCLAEWGISASDNRCVFSVENGRGLRQLRVVALYEETGTVCQVLSRARRLEVCGSSPERTSGWEM